RGDPTSSSTCRTSIPTSPTSLGSPASRSCCSPRAEPAPLRARSAPVRFIGVATLEELALLHTPIDGEALAHLRRPALSWRLLSDLCFADLLLLAPVANEDGHRFVVLAQVRPTTGQTLYVYDLVGHVVDEVERPLVTRAFNREEIVEGETNVLGSKERVRL